MNDVIEIPAPDDFHVHLREEPALAHYAADAARFFDRALVMPNTVPPVVTPEEVSAYSREIVEATEPVNPHFRPLPTFKLLSRIDPSQVTHLREAGAVAGKLYPVGATTHAEDGIRSVEEIYPVLEQMQNEGLVLCIHGEDPSAFVLDREEAYLPILERIASDFPRLRIVLEHITSAAAVEKLYRLPETVAATVTLHHLVLTLDDVVGGLLDPHSFCKPIPKFPRDRDALREIAFRGDPRVFFGSDSAPHQVGSKECADGFPGIYTAPVAIPVLLEMFEAESDLDAFVRFTARNGARFYGLPQSERTVRYERRTWTVPETVFDVVPFRAGQPCRFRLERDDGYDGDVLGL